MPSIEDPGSISRAVVGGGGSEVVEATDTELEALAASEVVVARVVATEVSSGTDDETTTVLESARATPDVGEDSLLVSTGLGEVTVVSGGVGPGSFPQPARAKTTDMQRPKTENWNTFSRHPVIFSGGTAKKRIFRADRTGIVRSEKPLACCCR
ncbi:MAG: hypothetical protein OXS29_08155 [bacterium]|nr:hypothetical protein [bacterium]